MPLSSRCAALEVARVDSVRLEVPELRLVPLFRSLTHTKPIPLLGNAHPSKVVDSVGSPHIRPGHGPWVLTSGQ